MQGVNSCKGVWLQNGKRVARVQALTPELGRTGERCAQSLYRWQCPRARSWCHSQEPGRIGIGEVVHASSRGSTNAFQPDLLARCVCVHNLRRRRQTSNAAPLSCSPPGQVQFAHLRCVMAVFNMETAAGGTLAACNGRGSSSHCGSNMGRGSHSWAPKHQGLQMHSHHTMNPLLSSNLASPGQAMSSCSQMSASSAARERAAQPDGSCPISEEHWNVLDGLGSLKAVKYASSGLPPTHSL